MRAVEENSVCKCHNPVCTNRQTDKQNVASPFNEIVLSYEKE